MAARQTLILAYFMLYTVRVLDMIFILHKHFFKLMLNVQFDSNGSGMPYPSITTSLY